MRFDVITLFPDLFAAFLTSGVTRRAYASGLVEVKLWNPRDFAEGNYKRVDDRPFGGGPGMVMLAEPLALCLSAIRAERTSSNDPVVLFAVLICGRYEGVDQRFIDTSVTHHISLGDFVLSGGEIAAMALLDAVARLQPGVLNDEGSHQMDSFNPALDGLLDCPHYTRPEGWQGQTVPDVLMSGNHAHIERWRREQRLSLTQQQRPELVEKARVAGQLTANDETFLATLAGNSSQKS